MRKPGEPAEPPSCAPVNWNAQAAAARCCRVWTLLDGCTLLLLTVIYAVSVCLRVCCSFSAVRLWLAITHICNVFVSTISAHLGVGEGWKRVTQRDLNRIN